MKIVLFMGLWLLFATGVLLLLCKAIRKNASFNEDQNDTWKFLSEGNDNAEKRKKH